MKPQQISVQAPARLCLIGEHQDYFGLSVISAAMDLFLTMTGTPNEAGMFRFQLDDLNERVSFPIDEVFPYTKPRDYLRSCVHVMNKEGYRFNRGYDITVSSTIPIAKGNSSSSALVMCWLRFLSAIAKPAATLSDEALAWLGYRAEVLEFGEPGGMQDHYAIGLGGTIHIECKEPIIVQRIPRRLEGFLLVDSRKTKDTQGVLARIKNGVHSSLQRLMEFNKDTNLQTITEEEILNAIDLEIITDKNARMILAVARNRDLTKKASELLLTETQSGTEQLARLIKEHHRELRDGLDISTPEIEALMNTAYAAGALACKINGSGGGGCFLVYAPDRAAEVRIALESAGAWVHMVSIVDGVKLI